MEENIADVVSMITRIPVRKVAESEGQKLLKMKTEMSSKIVGQDRAIESLSKAIQRSRAGLKRIERPIGVFLFLGPTGVGKTETAKVLANYLFSKNQALIKLDMSEYGERFSVSRMIGAPPGYVGYEEGGELTEKVRRNPFSVILFDEIEKAHPDIFNVLLQMFDEGVLTDGLGRKVDFRNTIIILTSNIGTKQIQGGSLFGFSENSDDKNYNSIKNKILEKVSNVFNPEFLNRLDETIVLSLTVTKKAKVFITEKGFNPEYGVRFLRREIQSLIEDPLSELLLGKVFSKAKGVKIDFVQGHLEFFPIFAKVRKAPLKKSRKKPQKSINP